MGASHGHDHGLGRATAHRRVLFLVLTISITILIVEVVGAVAAGSLALLADAVHMLTDVAGLGLALVAADLMTRPATLERTWGYRRTEVLAAALQAAILLAVGGFVLFEGVRRLLDPPEVDAQIVLVFGLVGLAGNLVSIWLLSRIRSDNLNTRAAFLEVVNDALGSVAVLISAVVILATGWARADALVSILIGALIMPRTLLLLRDTVDVLLERTPRSLDLREVRAHILRVDHVHDVHDLHASLISSDLPILSAHVVVADGCFLDGYLPQLLDQLQECIGSHFDVEHSTFQFEPASHVEHEGGAHDA